MSEKRPVRESMSEYLRKKEAALKARYEVPASPEMLEQYQRMTEYLLHTTPEELREFRARIRNVAGVVRIAVHPLSVGKWKGTFHARADDPRNAEDIHEMLSDGFARTLKSVVRSEASAPILVYEEDDQLQRTAAYITEVTGVAQKDFVRRGIILCPTASGDGILSAERASKAYESVQPVPDEETYEALYAETETLRKIRYTPTALGAPDRVTMQARRERINAIIEGRRNTLNAALIKTMDIRNALVSGAYFFLRDQGGDKRLEGCAGGVAQSLRTVGVKVDISKYSWAPRDAMKAEGFVTKDSGKAGERKRMQGRARLKRTA